MLKHLMLLTALLFSTSAFASDYLKGEVDKIISGDTIIVDTRKGDVKVRLYGIDAPENNQKYGNESRQLLKNLIDDQDVKVRIIDTDYAGTVIGKVYYRGEYINETMLENGAAWYDSSNADDKRLERAERQAQKRGAGLWRYRNPVPPWVFRQRQERLSHKPAIKYGNKKGFSINIDFFSDDDDDYYDPYDRPHQRNHDKYYDYDRRHR